MRPDHASAPVLHRFVDAHPEPWRNGRGSTRVLYSDAASGSADWSLRVSVADISGPSTFSTFIGVDRHVLTLGPGRLSLAIDGTEAELEPCEFRSFRGEAPVVGRPLGASTHVLNVMARRGICCARLTVTDHQTHGAADGSDEVTLLVALRACDLDGRVLDQLDLIVLPADSEPVRCTGLHAAINVTGPERATTH